VGIVFSIKELASGTQFEDKEVPVTPKISDAPRWKQ